MADEEKGAELTEEELRETYDPLSAEVTPSFSPEYSQPLWAGVDRANAERKAKGEALPAEEPRPSTLYPDYD